MRPTTPSPTMRKAPDAMTRRTTGLGFENPRLFPALRLCSVSLASALALASSSACSVFTDLDVSGYGPLPPVDAGQADGASCVADACPGLGFTCLAGSSCSAGSVCCLDVTPSSLTACLPACSGPSLQLCATSAECVSGTSCVQQTCSIPGIASQHLGACGGTLPDCTAD